VKERQRDMAVERDSITEKNSSMERKFKGTKTAATGTTNAEAKKGGLWDRLVCRKRCWDPGTSV